MGFLFFSTSWYGDPQVKICFAWWPVHSWPKVILYKLLKTNFSTHQFQHSIFYSIQSGIFEKPVNFHTEGAATPSKNFKQVGVNFLFLCQLGQTGSLMMCALIGHWAEKVWKIGRWQRRGKQWGSQSPTAGRGAVRRCRWLGKRLGCWRNSTNRPPPPHTYLFLSSSGFSIARRTAPFYSPTHPHPILLAATVKLLVAEWLFYHKEGGGDKNVRSWEAGVAIREGRPVTHFWMICWVQTHRLGTTALQGCCKHYRNNVCVLASQKNHKLLSVFILSTMNHIYSTKGIN